MCAVLKERRYQDMKWGTSTERRHPIGEWLVILEGELAEAKEAWLRRNNEDALKEILQVAAVGMACLEEHGTVKR
jgi:hypothetical protein